MNKLIISTIASAVALGFAGAAHAVLLDFVGEAATNERGVASGSSFASPNFGGLTLQFDADNPARFPYFDDLSDGKPAGLGLCKAIAGGAGNPCDNTADDNISTGEGVTVTLPMAFNLTSLSFTDEFHDSLNNSAATLFIEINGGGAFAITFMQAVLDAANGVFTNVTSIRFAFGGQNADQFYVNGIGLADIPLPGALPLLLAGLAGLGFTARRKKAA